MKWWPTEGSSRWMGRANTAIDSLLYGLSVYGVPVAIAAMSLIAFFAWESQYSADGNTQLEFRIIQDANTLEPGQAKTQLAGIAPVRQFDTKLSEAPFWFTFEPRASPNQRTTIEFPSRHAKDTVCWDSTSLQRMGGANRNFANGEIRAVRAGFALELGSLQSPMPILCKATFAGPARLSVVQWPTPGFEAWTRKFHRDSGLVEGGLIVLAIFVMVTAVVNREWLYVLFAAWLVANLRLAAISAGWDTQWLERVIPYDWMIPLRKFTTTAYYILTITLFSRLFSDDLKRVGYASLLRLNQWSCLPLLVGAATLSYVQFLPLLWVSTALAGSVVVFLLVRILLITRSKVAMWYSASLMITLSANLYEVIAAALGAKGLLGTVNSVTAALSSSLIAALAIAEQMRQERHERVRAQAELHSAYEAIPIGLFTLSLDGLFMQANPALREMVALCSDKPAHWSDYFETGAWNKLQDLVAKKIDQEIEIRSLPKNAEEPRWFLVKATLAKKKIEGSLQDITARITAAERLNFLAEHDPLTGILNRRGIEKILDEVITPKVNGRPMALAYLDLDRFKLINDLFGHTAGDEVLKQVGQRIKGMLTDGQYLGRVGGDEFVILFHGTSIQSATWTCRGVVERIGTAPYQIGERAFQIRGSIGLIEVSSGTKVQDVISLADRACREAKKGNHNNLVVYEKNSPVVQLREDELRLVERFGANTAPDGLFLMMQPIMSATAPYDSLNFEILLRMREADNSITPAGKIIAAAESNGRIAVIDRWVLSNTLAWLDKHNSHLNNTRFVCVNLSGGSLNDEKFVQDAFSMLANSGRIAHRICIEITESVALHDLENTRRFIDKVRGYGAKVALDDFGAGYTSFSYLRELPADVVKIDGTFVKNLTSHPANLAIVAAIVELVRNLGMKSVAEWAEDRATVEALCEVGIDYIQGYAIARPQHPYSMLLAESAASFIDNEEVALFVRNSLAGGKTEELWDQFGDPSRIRVH